VQIADEILRDMRASRFGVLYIKEKEKSSGEKFGGGGPPAFGWYAAALGYIYHREGNRSDDLKYVAGVVDQFPWNEEGWWSADIDVKTGVSKQPLSKPSPVNKTASVAMAAGMLGAYVKDIDPALSDRLKKKASQCIQRQIIPAQLPDGFWHYGLTGNDPKNKDVFGYFMLATDVLCRLQMLMPEYREEALNASLQKAGTFALKSLAPMTDPNQGPPCREHATSSTPSHFSAKSDNKRAFQLGAILLAQKHVGEAVRITDEALKHFPIGNLGEDGAHACCPAATMLYLLKHP
jgi:hypothetical protein